MNGRENILNIKPSPPPSLNKELRGIWNGWTRIGDREVVREAVVKGAHIDLAHTFLAIRKELDDTKIKKWFKEEVFRWVFELLSRQQVFKASHILTNLGLNPDQEFIGIFKETFDKDTRNFLGNHLVKCGKLEVNLIETWKFLQILDDNDDVLMGTNDEFIDFNIQVLDDKSIAWKGDVGTALFFKTHDTTLTPLLTANKIWSYLLKHQEMDLIKSWIAICFAKDITMQPSISKAYDTLFVEFQITEEMINFLFDEVTNFSIDTQQTILDELSKFGVFSSYEKVNLELILQRIIKSEQLNALPEILNSKHSRLSMIQFNELLLDYCIKNSLFTVINMFDINFDAHQDFIQKNHCKFFDLISYLKSNSEVRIGDSILKTAEFLGDDLKPYFASHPLIFLAILMFSYQSIDLLAMFKCGVEICIKDIRINPETINEILLELRFLKQIIQPNIKSISYYDLLRDHNNLNTDIFNFRLIDNILPNFNSNSLVEKYGYKKRINYGFYITQARPSFATKLYSLNNLKTPYDMKSVNRKVFKIVVSNFLNKEISSSCVAFLEMVGLNSRNIRVYIKAANIFYESGMHSFEEIQDLLQNVLENPVSFLEKLEKVLIGNFLAPEYTNFDLVEEIRKQEIVVEFSLVHNLKLPVLFLECCAKHNYWFPFLLFIQKHNYPLEQVQKLIYNFTNSVMADHLYHGLTHDIQIDEQRDLLMRDTRKYYLSRIGVRKNLELNTDSIHSSISSFGSYGSTGSSSGSSDFFENDTADFRTDVLQILIKCHNSVDPPKALLQACFFYKNPIFAVLATSYEPDSKISNWFTWLVVSCGIENEFSSRESGVLSAPLVTRILNISIEKCYHKILLESFLIFLAENPLRIIVDFLIDCMELNFDEDNLILKLKEFQMELMSYKSSTMSMDVDYEMMFLNNKSWIENTAIQLCCTSLHYNYKSQYNQLRFLKLLDKIAFGDYFTIEIPNFFKYYDILNSLFEYECDIRINLSVIDDKDLIKQEVLYCVDKLVLLKQYKCAFIIAKISCFCTDSIIINEWRHLFEIHNRSSDFWIKCDMTFKEVDLKATSAVDFFEKCVQEIHDNLEKYKVLTIAHEWASLYNLPNLYKIEKKLWIAYFEIDNKVANHEFKKMSTQKLLFSEMQQQLEMIVNDESVFLLNEDNIKHINEAIHRLLLLGDFWSALRLSKIFKYDSVDLEVIILGCSLAEGLLMPYQLSTHQRLLLNKQGHHPFTNRTRRRLISSKAFSGFCSGPASPSATTVTHMMDHIDAPFHDTLASLETLSECGKFGCQIVQDVMLTYRIALNIEKSYQEVFKCENHLSMLKNALRSNCTNKLEVVNDFIVLFKWSNEQIAEFLCEELVITIKEQGKQKLEPLVLWNINLEADFNLILQLLNENCSILGLKLYIYASNLHKIQTRSSADFKMEHIELAINLLIRAHDCFTADCNMEGISTILRKCQSIISLLLTLKNWKLIVRVLTGVARYTEMNYVLHILRENEQFEFLLRKGSRRDNSLKVALLKYLKKYCPENRELYRMVALHFTLFSEIAQLWEEEARSIVRNLIAISKLEMQNNGLNLESQPYVLLTNTDGTKICLNKAMVNYTHATEYHLQGEKLAKAMCAAKQAELLALQISMLKGLSNNSATICILNLSELQIASLITTQLSFSQVLILIEAYNYKADWATVLFEQFIIRNDASYLHGFLSTFSLTDSIVNDISRKYIGLKTVSDSETRNLKEIVNKSNSVSTKYRIASELSFFDLLEDLLVGNQLAFLKDTVWKKGYKS